MTGFLVPNESSVAEMLGMLYGGDVDAVKEDCRSADGCYAASFVDDDGKLVAICLADLPFLAYSGAALSMLPPDSAKEMIAEGDPSKTLMDNFYEVMNVCSRFFMSDNSPHLRLKSIHQKAETPELMAQLGAPRLSVGFNISVPRYGKGSLSFLAQ